MSGMALRIASVVTALIGLGGPALAEHDHTQTAAPVAGDPPPPSEVSASVSLLAARFDTMYYVGSYQGVAPSVSWARGPLALSASLPVYHLLENGLDVYGVGDAMVHATAGLASAPWGRLGASVMMMIPMSAGLDGLGMGHVMAEPAVWAIAPVGDVTLSGSLGYTRALASLADHVHGTWPLVDPMNMSEIAWSAGVALGVGRGVRVGGRLFGGAPIGAPGVDRVIAAGRLGWGDSRVSTGVEVQAGLVGDPFSVRGVVDTAVRF